MKFFHVLNKNDTDTTIDLSELTAALANPAFVEFYRTGYLIVSILIVLWHAHIQVALVCVFQVVTFVMFSFGKSRLP